MSAHAYLEASDLATRIVKLINESLTPDERLAIFGQLSTRACETHGEIDCPRRGC